MLTFDDLPEGWELEAKNERRQIDVLRLKDSEFRISIEVSGHKWFVDSHELQNGKFNTWKKRSDYFNTEAEAINWAVVAINTGLYKDWL